jgi:hypothetical protein
MHSRASSASDSFYTSFGDKYQSTKTLAPSMQSIEDLIKLELAIQQEIGSQLANVGAGLSKDLKITKNLVEVHLPSGISAYIRVIMEKLLKRRVGLSNSVLARVHEVWQAHREQDEQAAELRVKSEAIRESYIAVKRKLATVNQQVDREMHKVEERQVLLAKADKGLNEAARLILKARSEQKGGSRMVGSPRRTGSGSTA